MIYKMDITDLDLKGLNKQILDTNQITFGGVPVLVLDENTVFGAELDARGHPRVYVGIPYTKKGKS